MNNKKQKFVNLKIAGFAVSEICDILNISRTTAYRWGISLAGEISVIRNQKEIAENELMSEKIDDYMQFLNKNFKILNTELSFHKDIRVPYHKILDYSMQIFKSYKNLSELKKMINVPVKNDSLNKIAENFCEEENETSTNQ